MKLNRLDGPYSVYGECVSCKNLTEHKYFAESVEYRPCCKAYPEGIPPDVWKSLAEHAPVNGYAFEEKERDGSFKLDDFEITEDDSEE